MATSTGQPGAGTEDPHDNNPQGDNTGSAAGEGAGAGQSQEGGDGAGGNGQQQQDSGTKTFTQAEVNRLIAKERRDLEKKAKEAEERAKLSEQERVKAEADALRAQLAERDARDAVQQAAAKLGSENPAAIYKLIKDELVFDGGKITNLNEALADAKDLYPQLFIKSKPTGTPPDGSQGSGQGQTALLTREQMEKMSPKELIANEDLVNRSLKALKR